VLAVVLALAAAVGYGGSDFAAGLAARTSGVLVVTFVATVASVILTFLVLPAMATRAPSAAALAWGAAAGIGGMSGALALYAGFRRAAFSVAGPLSAVSAAGLSVVAGVLLGERPAVLSLAGIVVALPAIVLVSYTATSQGDLESQPRQSPPDEPRRAAGGERRPVGERGQQAWHGRPAGPRPAGRQGTGLPGAGLPEPGHRAAGRAWAGVAWGLAAGIGFALLFVALNRAGNAAGIWPVASGQVVEVIVLAGLVAATGGFRRGWLRGGLPTDSPTGAAALPATAVRPAATGGPDVAARPGTAALPGAAGWSGRDAPPRSAAPSVSVARRGVAVLSGMVGLSVITGVTGGGATILYFVATHNGFLAITAVLTSLYPAITIALARVLAGERLTAARLAGLALAGASVTLIALGGAA
jgi:drug/metabolite transporter (DMT)-like permease